MKWSALFILCAMLAWNAGTLLASNTMVKQELETHIPGIDASRQFIVVTAGNWDAVSATVRCYERPSITSPWKEALPACDAVVGRNGLAWGIGLHGTHPAEGLVKREGDGRAPAGVFRLHEVFGFVSPAGARVTKFPYMQLTASSEGIDDVRSRYYNRVVDSARIKDKDWKTSETMVGPRGLYRWGIIVEHNWNQSPGYGSCIFLHVWQAPGHGTSGCTAMALTHLTAIIHWLDESKRPLFVQLPEAEYQRLKSGWRLP